MNRSPERRRRSDAGSPQALLRDLRALRTRFDRGAAEAKLARLRQAERIVIPDRAHLAELHDLLLFLRAYPDDARIRVQTERLLRSFELRVRAARPHPPTQGDDPLADSGIAGTSVSHVFSFRVARALASYAPSAVEIDWELYGNEATGHLTYALAPAMLWPEGEAVDHDEAFDARAWLERSRARRQPTALAALLQLLRTSGLSEALQETLYDGAEVPVRWDLSGPTGGAGSRTRRRLPGAPIYFQRSPLLGRTRDLRADLLRPAAPLRRLSAKSGAAYVRAIHEVLASRVRELFPLAGANPDEVYLHDPGRGVRIVLFGSVPAIRLPHESNFGALLLRNGVPVGYGVAALLFDRAEIAINVFPAYRSGESSFLIERFFHLFVRHFGARVLLVRSYQVGDENEEGLASGAFWFYDKLGFRAIRPEVRMLARRERARVAADPTYRTPLARLKRLAKSDQFFHLDPRRMGGYDDLRVADLGYAITRHLGRVHAGDRQAAVERAIARLTPLLGLGRIARWSESERSALRRMAPEVEALGGLSRWPRADRLLLGQAIRAKGGRCERDYVRLTQRLPRFERALRALAAREARRRALTLPGGERPRGR